MIKINICIIVILGLFSCTSNRHKYVNNFFDISTQIRKKKDRCLSLTRSELNIRSKIVDSLDFINFISDTIYILSTTSDQSSSYLRECIWTKKSKIAYIYEVNHLSWFNKPETSFNNRLFRMIEKWNTSKIKKEANKYGGMISGTPIIGMRVIIKDHIIQDLDCVSFDFFFDPTRATDYNPFN